MPSVATLTQADSRTSLPVVNLTDAKFECTYGRGCDGACCQNGRPGLYPDDDAYIRAGLDKFLPHLRPEARALIEAEGYSSRRHRGDRLPMLRVVGGWCVFFNEGCVLHKVGAMEGDKYRYKPIMCALFPLTQDEQGNWYIRQKGLKNEKWNLPCLDPAISTLRAEESLREELALAQTYSE